MVHHRHSLFFVSYRAFARCLPIARRLGFHFEAARAGETEGLIARHFTIPELMAKLQAAGLEQVRIVPHGQPAELLPLPRGVRQPITDHLPQGLRNRALRKYGHQLGVTARKRT